MGGLAQIETLAAAHSLQVFGGFHPGPGDDAPDGCGTIVLLSPREPGFWPQFTRQPEYNDRAPDPLDRWSERVIREMAAALDAQALFPSAGPPYKPFFRWALSTGHAWPSPITLMVHETMGLWASIRGALALPACLTLPPRPARPCDSCVGAPCLRACPVGAFTDQGYDVPACHAYLDTPAGQGCLTRGCQARSVCPVSQAYGRMNEQSAFHMASFHP